MEEAGTEQGIKSSVRPEPTTFTSSQQADKHISAFREWASSAEFRDLDKTRKELLGNLAPINKNTEERKRVYRRELGIVTEWFAFQTFQQELAKHKGVGISITKSSPEDDRKFHYDIAVTVLGREYYIDVTDSKIGANSKANMPYELGHMNIPAYIDPHHTGIRIVMDIAAELLPHLDSAQLREFQRFSK